ncbi:hypothetical protein VitviT2T_001480 [Vitis vinifera]|uniref:Ubiquitin-like protease family profile domain-containing protein n=1 Tax=Vitis vinifera TaxID=29760 RepID=A0ABY9BH69_VITVI|nr:hypothetical protein VitviT2T_001480 [Vitis vinifera]
MEPETNVDHDTNVDAENSDEIWHQYHDAERAIDQYQRGIQQQLRIMCGLMHKLGTRRHSGVNSDVGGHSSYAPANTPTTNDHAFLGDEYMASHAANHVLDTPDRVVAPEYELQSSVPINVVSNGEEQPEGNVVPTNRNVRKRRVCRMAPNLLSPYISQPQTKQSAIKIDLKQAVALVVDAYCRLLQYEHESKSKLFLSPYIAEMIIHSQAKHLVREVVIGHFEPHLYQMDIPYVNVNEVFLPVLIKNHWTLYVYDLANKRIQLLDSRPGRKKTMLSGVQQNLAKVVLWLAAHKKEVSPYDLRTLNFITPDVPLQPNEHDCGVFVMKFMELWSMGGFSKSIDVADSERVDKFEVNGDRLKEAQHINRSLSVLGDVISALAQKSPHVPYRNRGQAKTLMFVHISPEPDADGETISTVKFAERFATVELDAARVNKDSADVKELKEQIGTLKAALARKKENQRTFNIHFPTVLKDREQKPLLQNIVKYSELHFPPDNNALSANCKDLCQKLLRRNPVERLTFEELFNHLFLSQKQPDEALRRSSRINDGFPFSECNPVRKTEASSQEDCMSFPLDDDSSGAEGSPSFLRKRSSMKSTYGFSLDNKVDIRETIFNTSNNTDPAFKYNSTSHKPEITGFRIDNLRPSNENVKEPLKSMEQRPMRSCSRVVDSLEELVDQDYVFVSGPPMDVSSSSAIASKPSHSQCKSGSAPLTSVNMKTKSSAPMPIAGAGITNTCYTGSLESHSSASSGTSQGSMDIGDALEQPSTHCMTRIKSLQQCASVITELVNEKTIEILFSKKILLNMEGHTPIFYAGVLDSLAVELKATKDFSKLYAGIAILGYIASVPESVNT